MGTFTRIESLESRQLLSGAMPLDTAEAGGTAVVRGNVFRDVNRNGVREAGEPAQPNIRVYIDYNNNGTRDGDAEPIAITNSLGTYRFEQAIAPETIRVRLLLAGTNFIQTRPADNAARVVVTTVGGNHELESFGVAEREASGVTVLTGIVYTDRNRSGTRQADEPGRPNVSVYIDANENGAHDVGELLTKTNIEGRYYFERITAGTKVIRLQFTGTNLQQTQPTNGQPVRKTVVLNQVNQADWFGVAERTEPVTTAIVTGNVFYDSNNNATRDPTEPGRANVRVFLDLDNDSIRDALEPTVLTNFLGQYRFGRAPVQTGLQIRLDLTGTPLRQTLPTGNGARVLNTVAGQTYVDQNFGVREIEAPTRGMITGRVFNDLDRDGVIDGGEAGVANRSVYLDVNNSGFRDPGDPQTLTNIEGRYYFTVAPGTYKVRLYRGEFTQTSPPNNGSHTATVVAGGRVDGLHFGIVRTAGVLTSLAPTTTISRERDLVALALV